MLFRLKAFSIHLLISLLIALISLIVVYFCWYPSPLAKAFEVGHVFLLLLAVDTTLGPLLTFLVAKQGKKTLKMDLAIIGLLQFSAYLYGIYHIAVGRPAWIAFNQSRFEAVSVNALHFPETKIGLPKVSFFKPQWTAVRAPKDEQERNDWLFMELQELISPAARPELYVPLEGMWTQILEKSLALDELNKRNTKEEIETVLQKYPEADAYLPLLTPMDVISVLINKESKEIIAIVDLKSD